MSGPSTLRSDRPRSRVAIPFKLYGTVKDPWGKLRLGVEAGLTINRQDYGVAYGQTFDSGSLVVGNDGRSRCS